MSSMAADARRQEGSLPSGAEAAALPRISPPPPIESTSARLQAQIRYAASSTTMLRWALIALVGGPALASLIGFLGLCMGGHVMAGPGEAQLGPIIAGTLFLCVAGTGAALGVALPT